MKQLIKRVKQFSMLLLAISFLGCENNDDDNFPEVIAGFTYTINVDSGTVTFINTSVNSRNYFWTFGDGTSSTEINPIKTFTTGEYKVTLKATNASGASDTYEDTIVISDVGAPIITLLGNTTINIMIGGTFTDPGATATDDVDGDLTAKIVVGGDAVNVNTAGTYIITYNVSDAAGNAATQRTRTVIVAADVVAPVITLTGSATINILVGGTFTDPGATATDNIDGNITANIVVAGDAVNVNTAGTYIITYNVSDAAGNAATQKTRTVIVTAVPVTSGAYLYATSGTVTIASTFADWGTGTTINPNYTGNATYNPSIQLISGNGWGPVSAVAFTAMEAGILSNYSTLEFKVRTSDYTSVKVKVPEVEKSFTLASGTPLAGGWIQMSIPLSNFGGAVNTAVEFAIFEFGAGTMLITDVMLSGDGSVVPPSGCPAPPAGELLSNGDFEAGDVCWQFFAGTSVSSTVNNGGSKSAEIQGSTGSATGIKMERFAVGSILPNTSYTVSFDIIASGPFGEGGLMKAFTFSEGADGGSVPATQHVLTDNTTSIATTWER
ncbi:MAG: DUF5011 domain-containing protein, partial [Lutibacter sp.]